MERLQRLIRSKAAIAAMFVLVLGLISVASVCVHWQAHDGAYWHPDEAIARAVVQHVLATKKKDTNWARTDVENAFRYDQFNFSSYYLTAAKLEKSLDHRSEDLANSRSLVVNLRKQNVVIGGLIVFFAGLLGWRIAGSGAGIVAAALTATSVTLFQDSIYARPEAFVTLLTLLFVLILASRHLKDWMQLCLSGLALGLLLASKFTFVMYVPFPPLVILARAYARPAPHAPLHPWLACAALAGYGASIATTFALGVPYAIKAPWEYLNGVAYLLRQYSTWDWAFSLSSQGVGPRIVRGIGYLVETQGWTTLALAVLALIGFLRRKNHVALLAIAGPLLTLVYFLQANTFFERNFSHALPVLFVLSGAGFVFLIDWLRSQVRPGPVRLALAIATAAILGALILPTPIRISTLLLDVIQGNPESDQKSEAAQRQASHDGAWPLIFVHTDFGIIERVSSAFCGKQIYEVLDYSDPYTRNHVAELEKNGFRLEFDLPGPFGNMMAPTLQSVHGPGAKFLSTPETKPGRECKIELVSLQKAENATEIAVHTQMTNTWSESSFPSEPWLPKWPHRYFTSGPDANVGEFRIDSFQACGDVFVPFAVGPGPGQDFGWSIRRTIGDRTETLTDGELPHTVTPTAARILSTGECATYSISAFDHGSGWGQWLGIGAPMEQRDAAAAASAAADTAANSQNPTRREQTSPAALHPTKNRTP